LAGWLLAAGCWLLAACSCLGGSRLVPFRWWLADVLLLSFINRGMEHVRNHLFVSESMLPET
jgi:hypothetical protein